MTRLGARVVLYACHEIGSPRTSLAELARYADELGLVVHKALFDTSPLHVDAARRPQWPLAARLLQNRVVAGLVAPKETQIALRHAGQRELRSWLLGLGAFAHFPLNESVPPSPTTAYEEGGYLATAVTRILAPGGEQRVKADDFALVRAGLESLVARVLRHTRGRETDPARRCARLAADEATRKLNSRPASQKSENAYLVKLARCAKALLAHAQRLEASPTPLRLGPDSQLPA